MTAEVVIANSGAVALAADSAVTIGGQKIYNSALKLFSLSKVAPVGVMVFGNAGLISVPWETIIKQYRSNLSGKTFPELRDYAKDFLKYISQTDYFPDEFQRKWVERNLYGYYREVVIHSIKSLVKSRLDEQGEIDEDETKDITAAVIKHYHESLSKIDRVEGMSANFETSLKRTYKDIFDSAIMESFQGLPISASLKNKLRDIGVFLHTRNFFSSGISGLVVAGFGEDEIYPSVCTYEIEGVVGNRLKYRHLDDKSHKIRDGSDCAIVPFAQEDMVAAFMNGFNPDINRFINSYLQKILSRLPELLSDEVIKGGKKKTAIIKDAYRKDIDHLFKTFGEDLKDHVQTNHVSPVMSMVRVLPKDELAAMAESLVNLTAFKRRMTDSLETVGGPIDVAVISKGDGLVWVKRKHYFPPELNQHFFSNYFRGI